MRIEQKGRLEGERGRGGGATMVIWVLLRVVQKRMGRFTADEKVEAAV